MDGPQKKKHIIDASIPIPWNPPMDCYEEYKDHHIPHATYLSVDKVKDPSSQLPHMMPPDAIFRKYAEDTGLAPDH